MFTYHIDPGHGWIEVTQADLDAIGLSLAALSRYSYRKGSTLYLEEDCDAVRFIGAYTRHHGKAPQFTEKHGGEFIRRLPRIR